MSTSWSTRRMLRQRFDRLGRLPPAGGAPPPRRGGWWGWWAAWRPWRLQPSTFASSEVSGLSFPRPDAPSTTLRLVEAPEIEYARNGDVSIAYQVIGDGPIDLLLAPFTNNLEYAWTHPLWPRAYGRLASFSRLVSLDKRGTGLSDR